MNQLERDLCEALRRREPSEGFADKVMARARAADVGKGKSSLRWLAAAALVLLMLGGFAVVRVQQRHAEGEKTKEQLLVALRITGSKLRLAQSKLAGIQQRTIQLQTEQ